MRFGKDHLVYRVAEHAFLAPCCVCNEEWEFGPDYWEFRVSQAGHVTDYGPVCDRCEAKIRRQAGIPEVDEGIA